MMTSQWLLAVKSPFKNINLILISIINENVQRKLRTSEHITGESSQWHEKNWYFYHSMASYGVCRIYYMHKIHKLHQLTSKWIFDLRILSQFTDILASSWNFAIQQLTNLVWINHTKVENSINVNIHII